MQSRLEKIIEDKDLVKKIQEKLPSMFTRAERYAMRGGKVGMEVGKIRERPIIALLIYKFGKENVDGDLSDAEKEIDVKLFGKPISIKTISNQTLSGIKAVWTVDRESCVKFVESYKSSSDMILVQILWNNVGKIFLIPLEVQNEVINEIGIERYLDLPKEGTNPRGVTFSREGMSQITEHTKTKSIDITWKRPDTLDFDPYAEWFEYWTEN